MLLQEQIQMLQKIKKIAGEDIVKLIDNFEKEYYREDFKDYEVEEKALYGLIEKLKYNRDNLDKAIHWFSKLNSAVNNCRVVCSK